MTSDPAPFLVTCVGVEHDLELLPHFLDHYAALGIRPDRIRPILNAPEPESDGLRRAREMLADRGVSVAEVWIAPYTSGDMWQMRRHVQSRDVPDDAWVISADVDELHEYPDALGAILDWCDRNRVNCVQGPLIDRLAADGTLAPIRAETTLFQQFPVAAEVMWTIGGRGRRHDRSGTVKVMASKGRILPSRGGHHPQRDTRGARYLFGAPLAVFPGLERPAFRFDLPLRVHHFHWTEKLETRLRRRLGTRGVSPAGAEYGSKQLDYLATHGGFDLSAFAIAPDLSCKDWTGRVARLRRQAPWWMQVARARARGQRAVGTVRHFKDRMGI